jgi:hypothetical protein
VTGEMNSLARSAVELQPAGADPPGGVEIERGGMGNLDGGAKQPFAPPEGPQDIDPV